MNNIKKNVNKGFSLVELIVVVAIMAVLTAVLAPSLLAYVERSRAQKDDSAMGEVTNAIMLALADQDVYDEVLCFTCTNNFSCYIDEEGDTAKTDAANKVLTKNVVADEEGDTTLIDDVTGFKGDHFLYNDNERLEDENAYVAAGLMRGVTITFYPHKSANKSVFKLTEGTINDMRGAVTSALAREFEYINGTAPVEDATLGSMDSASAAGHHYLYNRVRATVGDQIELTSQTYRNSEYTVFIRMGTTGGFQADAQDAIMVYGQWNGTNLDIK